MKLSCPGEPHLTYCTNIHPGESWDEVRQNLERYVLAVRERVAPNRPFGVGLRLSGRAARELEGERLDRLRDFLAAHGLYVFTINGFPYGPFHGQPVKERVYLPDWLDAERVRYSDRLASILSTLLPDGVDGSVSTVPGAFKPRVDSEAAADQIARNILEHAATLWSLHQRTGRRVSLALEPEPFCQLETIAETVDFFSRRLHSSSAVDAFARRAGASRSEAEDFLRAHVGVCFDACHMAVEFEPVREALQSLRSAGIRICKIQISAGLRIDPVGPEALEALKPYAEGVYLHQVVERSSAGLTRWLDLPEALKAARDGQREWRVHFHVPLFREKLGPFHTTQAYLRELLDVVRQESVSPHLEVETYTWEVLPEKLRAQGIVHDVARELAWVLDRLS